MKLVAKETGTKKMLYTMDDFQLLRLRVVIRCFSEIREINDPVTQSEILTNAQMLLTAFFLDLKPLVGDQNQLCPAENQSRPDRDICRLAKGDLALDSLSTGSTWLIATASALSPLIALLIGFAGTTRLLRWQLAEKRDRTPSKGRRR